MGTYSLEVTDSIASTVGTWNDPVCGGNPFSNTYLSNVGWTTGAACSPNSSPDVRIRFLFSLITPSIRLDGGPLIAFAGLPGGWTLTSATLDVRMGGFTLVSNAFLQFDATTEHAVSISNGHKLFTHPNPSGLSALDLFSNGWGVRLVTTFANAGCTLQGIGSPVAITGSYVLAQTWTITTPQPVLYGRNLSNGTELAPTVTVVRDNPASPGLLNGVASIDLSYTDAAGNPQVVNIPASEFQSQNDVQLVFFILFIYFDNVPLPPSTTVTVTGNGDGVVFSGSIALGTLEILVESGTGIYRIVSGKRNDTIYLPDGSTVDVEIPDPFFKTAFIGG